MDSRLLSVSEQNILSGGDSGQTNYVVSVADERPVNLTNAVVSIDNSRDVVIGNVYHHYHSPFPLCQNRHSTELAINGTQTTKVTTGSNSTESQILSEDFLTEKKKTFTAKRIAICSASTCSVIILIILLLWIFLQQKDHTVEVENDEDVKVTLPKPSFTFGNTASLKGCNIVEEEDWGIKRNLGDIVLKQPVPLVIVSHSVTPFCDSFKKCKDRVENIQQYHISQGSPDIGYNFIIGGDANIYVGRGWDARNFHMGNHSIGLNFIGNYFRDVLTPEMIRCAKALLEYGVKTGKLTKDYALVCHNQTAIRSPTASPGPNVCGEIKKWPHYLNGPLDWNYLYGV